MLEVLKRIYLVIRECQSSYTYELALQKSSFIILYSSSRCILALLQHASVVLILSCMPMNISIAITTATIKENQSHVPVLRPCVSCPLEWSIAIPSWGSYDQGGGILKYFWCVGCFGWGDTLSYDSNLFLTCICESWCYLCVSSSFLAAREPLGLILWHWETHCRLLDCLKLKCMLLDSDLIIVNSVLIIIQRLCGDYI